MVRDSSPLGQPSRSIPEEIPLIISLSVFGREILFFEIGRRIIDGPEGPSLVRLESTSELAQEPDNFESAEELPYGFARGVSETTRGKDVE